MSVNKEMPRKGSTQPQGKTQAGSQSKVTQQTTGARSQTPNRSGTPQRTGTAQRSGTPTTGQRPRGGAQIYRSKPKTGKQFGPLDIALLFGGLVLVGVVIWFGLNLGGTGTTVGTPTTAASGTGSSGTGDQAPARNEIPPAPGAPAPDFNLPANDGNTYSLSQFIGKPVLLEFMAPWCPHCQGDTPIFNEVYEKYKDKVQVMGVSAHPYGRAYEQEQLVPISMADLNSFRDEFGSKYPLLLDTAVKSGDDYAIMYFPTVFIIDKNGLVAEQINAERDNPITVERLSIALDKVLQ